MSIADSSVDETPRPPMMDAEEVIAAASAVAERAGPIKTEITLVTGVVLALRPVPPLAIRQAVLSVTPPPVPMVQIEGREELEPNPNDPAYLVAIEKQAVDQWFITAETMLLLGTSVQLLPEGYFAPESDEWLEPLVEGLGIKVDVSNKYRRYLAWLKYYAIVGELDQLRVMDAVTMLSGVPEIEVQRAVAAFRGDTERRADTDETAA